MAFNFIRYRTAQAKRTAKSNLSGVNSFYTAKLVDSYWKLTSECY